MAFMRIHCDVCGGTWEVYQRVSPADDQARQCPHCLSKIDRSAWERRVNALKTVDNANRVLYTDHAYNHRPLFTFDVVADHLYQNRGK